MKMYVPAFIVKRREHCHNLVKRYVRAEAIRSGPIRITRDNLEYISKRIFNILHGTYGTISYQYNANYIENSGGGILNKTSYYGLIVTKRNSEIVTCADYYEPNHTLMSAAVLIPGTEILIEHDRVVTREYTDVYTDMFTFIKPEGKVSRKEMDRIYEQYKPGEPLFRV
jgi:hypothetical protein